MGVWCTACHADDLAAIDKHEHAVEIFAQLITRFFEVVFVMLSDDLENRGQVLALHRSQFRSRTTAKNRKHHALLLIAAGCPEGRRADFAYRLAGAEGATDGYCIARP